MLRELYALFILSCFVCSSSSAQSTSARPLWYFSSLGGLCITEYMTGKASAKEIMYEAGFTPAGDPIYSTAIKYESKESIGFFGVIWEPRFNLYAHEDFVSASISAPVQFSIQAGDDLGIGIALPVFADVNIGMHSTFNNIDRYGAHVGFGVMGYVNTLYTSYENYQGSVFWLQPAVRIGFKFPIVVRNAFMDFYYWPGKTYDHNALTFEDVRSRRYFKFSAGVLLHYPNKTQRKPRKQEN
jgi:hypothetical protein